MKKYFKRILCVMLCLALFCSAVSCKPKETDTEAESGRPQTIEESDIMLVENGTSEYSILLREERTNAEVYAAREFNRLLSEASGVVLPVVFSADLAAGTKYISIGATALAEEAGITATREELTRNGFKIKSYRDGLIIVAPNESGLIYGVYRFFEENCNYMYYTPDEFVIDRGDNIPLKTFDFADWPDFLNRDVFNYNTRTYPENMMRLYLTGSNTSIWADYYGEGGWWSSLHDQSMTLQIVNYAVYRTRYPNWYVGGDGSNPSQNPQLCFTTALYDRDEYDRGDWSEENYNDGRHGLFWTFVYNLINNYIAVETTKSVFQLGMSDNYVFCTCDRCSADVDKYTTTGVNIRFVNAVAEEVKKWQEENCPERDINLTMFAYLTVVSPPVKKQGDVYVPIDPSVVVSDNVIIRYAPINDFYMFPLMDEENNPSAREAILGWSAIASKLAVWDYRVNFLEMILPFPQWMSAYDNIKTYYDYGFVDIFQQGCRTFGGQAFEAMDNWVRARLLWDINQNYQDLVNEFFAAYYGDAAAGLHEYMDYLTMHYLNHLYANGYYKGESHQSIINAQNFPRGFMLAVEEIFSRAYDSLQPLADSNPVRYQTLKDRLDGESIFYRYLQLQLYPHFYTTQEIAAMIDEFERITTMRGFLAMMTTSGYMSETIQSWRSSLL